MSASETEILMFHRIREAREVAFGLPDAWRVRGTSVTFDELLSRVGNRRVLQLEEVVEALEAKRKPPAGVVLTFDDGYAEWVQVGAQLAERGWFACFFWSAAMSADGPLHPVDEYYSLLDRATNQHFEISLPDDTTITGDLRSVKRKRALVRSGPKPFVVNPQTAQETLERVAEAVGARRQNVARELYLSEAHRKQLEAQGHTIGAHGIQHVRLTELDQEASFAEIAGSRKWLGGKPQWFAYPDGVFNRKVVELVRDTGFRAALTCVEGSVGANSDIFRLPRRFARPNAG
ncbi:MAG: polysaccharide deacetylase family protein [Nannocystaceae bacterium]